MEQEQYQLSLNLTVRFHHSCSAVTAVMRKAEEKQTLHMCIALSILYCEDLDYFSLLEIWYICYQERQVIAGITDDTLSSLWQCLKSLLKSNQNTDTLL